MGLNNFVGNNPPTNPPTNSPISQFNSILANAGANDAEDYLINYNKKFKNAGNTLHRDELVQQTLAVLIGKSKPNALLVGSAGVGKTKIVEDIAYRLANNDPLIPDALTDYTVYELPLSNIVAGSGIVGELEEKMQTVIEFIEDPNNKAILFIDEIHMLVGEHATYDKLAQILKPALARGDIRTIGATTLQESTNLQSDPAFNRRFSRLIVDELTKEQTIDILHHARSGLMKHYGNRVSISDDILPVVVNIADQYSGAGSHRPDNALTLLDRSIGEAIISRKQMEIKAQGDPTILAALKAVPIIPITEKQIRTTAMKLMTGHAKENTLDIQHLKDSLAKIKGQDDILDTLITALKRHTMHLYPQDRPIGWLFTGTSGVGKTEVTKIIAQELTGMPPITLNMTEYHDGASINRIIGSPAGYVGSDSHAELPFDCLESNPYQIILLDEFEKCDRSVQRLFMSAFEEGYIKDCKGRTIDFSKSIIVATTNAAHDNTARKKIGFMDSDVPKTRAQIASDLSVCFDTALLNRFETVLEFHEIDKETYGTILEETYARDVARIKSEHRRIHLPDTLPEADRDELVQTTYVPAFGARPAGKAIRTYIENQIV